MDLGRKWKDLFVEIIFIEITTFGISNKFRISRRKNTKFLNLNFRRISLNAHFRKRRH